MVEYMYLCMNIPAKVVRMLVSVECSVMSVATSLLRGKGLCVKVSTIFIGCSINCLRYILVACIDCCN